MECQIVCYFSQVNQRREVVNARARDSQYSNYFPIAGIGVDLCLASQRYITRVGGIAIAHCCPSGQTRDIRRDHTSTTHQAVSTILYLTATITSITVAGIAIVTCFRCTDDPISTTGVQRKTCS